MKKSLTMLLLLSMLLTALSLGWAGAEVATSTDMQPGEPSLR